ncbi:hypothetical protein [Enterococcus gallinarum]|uniref:hypothetical protein n=1 Tax=Enterococcus gallinarum TaxID=1353 RepID=UPI0039088A7D
MGVEMCLDRNGNITEKTFQNTVKAVKELIAKYPNITRNKIWRHYDVTGKNCPAPWVAKPSELERFKDAVFGKTSGSNSAAKPSTHLQNQVPIKSQKTACLAQVLPIKRCSTKVSHQMMKLATNTGRRATRTFMPHNSIIH